jgi:hypothetical protein
MQSRGKVTGLKIAIMSVCAAVLFGGASSCRAADNPKIPAAPPPPQLPTALVRAPVAKTQSDVASKTAAFGKIGKDATAVKTALDAHDLAGGLKLVEKTNSFRGTVSKLFEPRTGTIAILNFDQDYKTAMTAVVNVENFSKFPELKALVGKQILVTGKFIDYHGAPEAVLTNPDEVKVVE